MNYYQTKLHVISGSNYREIKKKVDDIFSKIERKTKRQPYVRSAYFLKQKVFFNIFWRHLFDKQHSFRAERLKYFSPALELIQSSRNHPTTVDNPNKNSESLHRFYGLTHEKFKFIIQIKQIKRTGKLYLVSIFPE